jgi:hypothetical protein
LKTTITPSPAYRSSVPLYLMIFSPTAAWYSRGSAIYVFRVGPLGEPGEAAQVAEERRNLSAVAFELLLRTGRNNQISHLRRQEAPQPAHAFDFANLAGDALFELLV